MHSSHQRLCQKLLSPNGLIKNEAKGPSKNKEEVKWELHKNYTDL
jgi:hypothetical protein